MTSAERLLELFFFALKGQKLEVQKLALDYQVSTRSISRDIASIKAFLADHRELIGGAELLYSASARGYYLKLDSFLTNEELLAITKVLIGCRPFSEKELLKIVDKLKKHTTFDDRTQLEELIKKELYHYSEVHHDCASVIDNLFKLTEQIRAKHYITITYHKMDRSQVKHRIMPLSIMFSEYYYYLIAYECDHASSVPHYFRIDRIVAMTVHRDCFTLTKEQEFDEGELRKKSQFMWPGPIRTIQFTFTGPSLQSVLDRIPTARVICTSNQVATIEAEVYGDGIKMFLLSQGAWVKVISPPEFVQDMKKAIQDMNDLYQ